MRLPARSSSSAPVTTRRTARTLRHFSSSASSRSRGHRGTIQGAPRRRPRGSARARPPRR
jgi:hypothetical protein